MSEKNKLIKILAVDDVPANIIALEAVFYRTNYKIVEAYSGKDALNILATQQDIALVLLDVQMPDMDGFETAMKIKKIKGCEDLPIIFITAVYSEDPFVKRGYQAGAIDYFSKPFDPELLRMKVDLYSSYRQKVNLLVEREKRISDTEELLEAGRKLSSIMEALTVGVVIADSQGKIVLTNESISKILKTKESLEKDVYGEILSWWEGNGHQLKEENGPLRNALDGNSTHNFRTEIICLDGSLVNLVISGSPLIDYERKITGAVLVIQDVTESKKLEEDFETKLANLISLGVGFEHFNSSNH
jgi:PAS domain S-box-containing protein